MASRLTHVNCAPAKVLRVDGLSDSCEDEGNRCLPRSSFRAAVYALVSFKSARRASGHCGAATRFPGVHAILPPNHSTRAAPLNRLPARALTIRFWPSHGHGATLHASETVRPPVFALCSPPWPSLRIDGLGFLHQLSRERCRLHMRANPSLTWELEVTRQRLRSKDPSGTTRQSENTWQLSRSNHQSSIASRKNGIPTLRSFLGGSQQYPPRSRAPSPSSQERNRPDTANDTPNDGPVVVGEDQLGLRMW